MGRSWRRRNKRQKKVGGEDEGTAGTEKRKSIVDKKSESYNVLEDHCNFRMEAFYAYQGVHNQLLEKELDECGNLVSFKFIDCDTDKQKQDERQRWLEAMKRTLPASFRFGNDVDSLLRERLEQELNEMVGGKMEIELEPRGGQMMAEKLDLKPEIQLVAPVQSLPFIPHGYQLSLDRSTIRRNPRLQSFHDWLKVQTEAGFVTRQETVSMIPPVVLDPQPHHMILDMAAAPGSKTSQLLECVNLPVKPGDHEPTGCVLANDYDPKRAYMLTHQIRRINSPAVFITSCDARHFPLLESSQDGISLVSEGIFDRVLADVPCSGDGTARKNPGVWKNWNTLNGYSLHPTQLAIALRGAQSTKVGGYLCYSTCSMNPIENEAVVAELLRVAEGSLELIDRGSQLQGLVARPGMSHWKNLAQTLSHKQIKDKQKKNSAKMQVRRKKWEDKQAENDEANDTTSSMEATEDVPLLFSNRTKFEPVSLIDEDALAEMVKSAGMIEYSSYADVPVSMHRRIRPSCFPPTDEEVSKFHLEFCMRIMPQDMNTGGFFVALLRKVAPLNARVRKRFEALQAELDDERIDDKNSCEGDEAHDEDPILKNGEGGESHDEEPILKKARFSSQENSNIDSRMKDEDKSAKVHIESGQNLKRGFVVDKNGNQSKTVGRDDLVPVSSEIFKPLKEYYGLDEESFREGQFMVRACSDGKILYFVSKTIKTRLIDAGLQEKLTVITTGLKAFIRNTKECEVPYRVAQEGIHFVAPHMSKRKLLADLKDFELCLSASTVLIGDFSEGFGKQLRELSMGCFVVSLKDYEDDYIKKLIIVMWRCRGDTVKFLVTQAEIDGMKSKLRAIKDESSRVPTTT